MAESTENITLEGQTDDGSITFLVRDDGDGPPCLELCSNGDIKRNGRLIANDDELVDGLKFFLNASSCNMRLPARRPTVPEVLPLVNEYYAKPGNLAGGHLHVVLDDGNVEDDFVIGCIKDAKEKNDLDGEFLAKLLLLMTKTQRRKLCAMKRRPSVLVAPENGVYEVTQDGLVKQEGDADVGSESSP